MQTLISDEDMDAIVKHSEAMTGSAQEFICAITHLQDAKAQMQQQPLAPHAAPIKELRLTEIIECSDAMASIVREFICTITQLQDVKVQMKRQSLALHPTPIEELFRLTEAESQLSHHIHDLQRDFEDYQSILEKISENLKLSLV